MKLEQIQEAWTLDSVIDKSELGHESLRTPELHNKYFKMMMLVGQDLRAYNAKYRTLYKLKWEYYLGQLDPDTLKVRKWEPFALKVLRADVEKYLEADLELQGVREQMDAHKAKFEFVESILKEIHQRGFRIKNAIDWEKFKNGN